MSHIQAKVILLSVVVLSSCLAISAQADVLFNVQTYNNAARSTVGPETIYSGAGVLGTAGDKWNSDNSILGQFAIQGAILSNVALVDSTNTPSSVTFSLSDAFTTTSAFGAPGFPLQNSSPSAGNLGDYWYATGNHLGPANVGSGASTADFIGTFGNLNSFNGLGYTLVVYGGGTSITSAGSTLAGTGAFGGSQGYTMFTGTVSGGQVQFDINNTQLGDGTSFVYLNGAQLFIAPEPNALILVGVGAAWLIAGARQRPRPYHGWDA